MSIAVSYARALFETARERNLRPEELLEIEKELHQVSMVVAENATCKIALEGPITSSKEKAAAVAAIAEKMGLGRLVTQFLELLAKKGRMPLLNSIKDKFGEVRLEREGGVFGDLVSAEPLSEQDVRSLSQAFEKKLGKKVAFRSTTDPSMLAGVKVTVGGVTYDGTLKSQLQRLRDQFVVGSMEALKRRGKFLR